MANELKVEGKLDLSKAQTLALSRGASDPGSADEGDMYYNTSSLVVRIYQNGAWQNLIASANSTNLPFTELFTLSNTDITNRYVTLSNTPANPVKVILTIIGGLAQAYGTDFVMNVNVLTWNGLTLDGVLTAGDMLIVQHD